LTSTATVFVSVLLLFLGIVSIILGVYASRYTVRGRDVRASALTILGVGALAAWVLILYGMPWDDLWQDILSPMLIVLAGAGAGLVLGAGILYVLVAAR
jgi:integral membrane sensor domain MASE1